MFCSSEIDEDENFSDSEKVTLVMIKAERSVSSIIGAICASQSLQRQVSFHSFQHGHQSLRVLGNKVPQSTPSSANPISGDSIIDGKRDLIF